MPLVIASKQDQVVVTKVEVADTYWKRFKGLLGQKEMPQNYALIINPCKQVHMFFMKFPIGAIFLNEQNAVIAKEQLKPWEVSKLQKKAKTIIETSPAKLELVELGDVLKIV